MLGTSTSVPPTPRHRPSNLSMNEEYCGCRGPDLPDLTAPPAGTIEVVAKDAHGQPLPHAQLTLADAAPEPATAAPPPADNTAPPTPAPTATPVEIEEVNVVARRLRVASPTTPAATGSHPILIITFFGVCICSSTRPAPSATQVSGSSAIEIGSRVACRSTKSRLLSSAPPPVSTIPCRRCRRRVRRPCARAPT